MRIAEDNWKVLALFPAGWRQMAWQSGAVERLRGFPSPDMRTPLGWRYVFGQASLLA
jgi:hypothetical protein